MKELAIKNWNELVDRVPVHAIVADVDLVVVRYDGSVSVLYGRCAHRGALMSDGSVDGASLICGVHGWDYRLDSGIVNTTTKKHWQNSVPGWKTVRFLLTKTKLANGP